MQQGGYFLQPCMLFTMVSRGCEVHGAAVSLCGRFYVRFQPKKTREGEDL